MYKKIINLPNLTLLVALCLSTVAAYYSIIGLTAIFAGAVIPVIIMGSMLEVAKITTTVWLRKYWNRAGWVIKMYLVPAVIALALLTSMGIFGFLSKAHLDQNIGSGDVQAKVALLDEKINIQRDNIKASKAALAQMDTQVNDIMTKGDSERSVERSVMIRKQQAKERASLMKDIEVANKEIQALNAERAPIASELRKVEAEVGPIKYIAALIYGDNADQNMLESAVRWVIILLVVVFDPLAIALVLAGNQSKEWNDDEPEYEPDNGPINEEALALLRAKVEQDLPTGELITKSELFPDPEEGNKLIDELEKEVPEVVLPNEPMQFVDFGEHPKDYDENQVEEPVVEEEKSILEQHPYLLNGFDHFSNTTPIVHKPEPKKVDFTQGRYEVSDPVMSYNIVLPEPAIEPAPMPEPTSEVFDRPGDYIVPEDTSELITPEVKQQFVEEEDGYVIYDGLHMSKDALKGMHPELFTLKADEGRPIKTNFGIGFPSQADKGDIFVRVDMLPNRVYKFDGHGKWIEVNKEITDTYLHNQKYLQHLVNMIERGQYDVELLSENEKAEIEEYLRKQNG
jgi:hypothetical protein